MDFAETVKAYEAHLIGKTVVSVEESPPLFHGRIRLVFNQGSTLDLGPSNLVRVNSHPVRPVTDPSDPAFDLDTTTTALRELAGYVRAHLAGHNADPELCAALEHADSVLAGDFVGTDH